MGQKFAMRWGVSLLVLLATACGDTKPSGSGGAGAAGVGAGGASGSLGAGGLSAGGFSTGGAGGTTSSSAGAGGEPPLGTVGPQQQSSKLDVLLVIDNSQNMADKQAILAASVPT